MERQDAELYIDCINKLVGAPEVKSRVLKALALGHPSYESQAHLVKCRVKGHDNLFKKIQDKRKIPEKKNYCAADVTDIVGLRLLALYRKDLPSLVSQFLTFLEAGQKTEIFLFDGTTLEEACTEVILYTSAPPEDAIDNAIIGVFEERGLSAVFSGDSPEDSGQEDKLHVQVERKASGYSSLHLIVWCKNVLNPTSEHLIPMEVQIRTSLEDVWGEIDHALKYKFQPSDDSAVAQVLKESADEHLTNLKVQLDACGRSADTIARQLGVSRSPSGTETTQRQAFSVNLGTLESLPVSDEVNVKLGPTIETLREALVHYRNGEFAKTIEDSLALASKFQDCAEGFVAAYNSVSFDHAGNEPEASRSCYYLLMEAALCFYWCGMIYAAAMEHGASESSSNIKAQPTEVLQKSLALYVKIQRKYAEQNDAILTYRKATVFSALGDDDFALEGYGEAVAQLEGHHQDNLEENHYLRVRIPRQFGIALWEQAERYRVRGIEMEDPDFRIGGRRKLYVQAIEQTIAILDFNIGESDAAYLGGPVDVEQEHLMTANNIIDYSLSYLRAGGSKDELAKLGLTKDRLIELAAALLPEGKISNVDVPIWLDTLRAFYSERLGDREAARSAANRIMEVIEKDKKKHIVKYGERFVSEMLVDARKELDLSE